MIDIATERLLTLKEAAAFLPRRPHLATMYRWMSRGIQGVRLERVKCGGTTYTSIEALQRFAEHLSCGNQNKHTSPSAASRADSAAAELERLGI